MSARVARIRRDNWLAINVREWGYPSGMYVGRAWRNGDEEHAMMSVVVRGQVDDSRIVETARVEFVDGAERLPAGWRDAFAAYVRAWPHSARAVARWARLSDRERIVIALRVLEPDLPGGPRDDIGKHGRRTIAAAILEVDR